jgi:hypothetical protein
VNYKYGEEITINKTYIINCYYDNHYKIILNNL